jgi:histidinol phosphatase-like enzyme (inositol monophosphatase family)
MDTKPYLEFGLEIVKRTRELILEKSRTGFSVITKSDNSPVTEADREAEQSIRKEIQARFPDHGIVGEEFGIHNEQAELKWYIDPIDGTISFSHGISLYGTMLALYQGDIPLVGIIDHPGLDQCYYASKGNGTWCNGERIIMQEAWDDIDNEIIATGDVKQFKDAGEWEAYKLLLEKHRLVRTIPDCYGHTLTAKGAVGAMVDFYLNIWDWMPTKIIVEEAGGKFELLKEFKIPDGRIKYSIICGKPEVVDYVKKFFV